MRQIVWTLAIVGFLCAGGGAILHHQGQARARAESERIELARKNRETERARELRDRAEAAFLAGIPDLPEADLRRISEECIAEITEDLGDLESGVLDWSFTSIAPSDMGAIEILSMRGVTMEAMSAATSADGAVESGIAQLRQSRPPFGPDIEVVVWELRDGFTGPKSWLRRYSCSPRSEGPAFVFAGRPARLD